MNRKILVFFLLWPTLLFLQDNHQGRKDEIDRELTKLKKQKNTLFDDIYALELSYEKENIKLHSIQTLLLKQNKRIAALNNDKTTLIDKIAQTKNTLTRSLRIMYKSRSQPTALLFIRVDTFSHHFNYYKYFSNLFNLKSQHLNNIKNQLLELSKLEEKIKREKTDYEANKKASESVLSELTQSKAQKITLIEKINNDQSYFNQLLDEIRIQSNRLNEVIDDQPFLDKIEKIDTAKVKGKMVWPISGRAIDRFGKVKSTKFNTFIFHNGIKIKPDKSDRVYAVYPGVVVFANYFKGYGNLIILRHSRDLYTLYGYCDSFAKKIGDWVNKSDFIANAGDTGSTVGKALYFEIRIGVKSEDPLLWFSK